MVNQVKGVQYGLEILAFVDYPEGNGDLKYVANLGNSSDLPAPAFKITTLKEKPAEVTPAPEATEAAPVVEEPKAEEPKKEAPKAKAPKAPKAEPAPAPVVEAPVVETPVAEAPKAKAPKAKAAPKAAPKADPKDDLKYKSELLRKLFSKK